MKKKLQNRVSNTKTYKKAKSWYKDVTLPGFGGVPIRHIIKVFINELRKDKIGPRASAISFSFMLALFPSIIFLFSLIPVIPIVGLQESVFELLQSILPDEAFILARETIEDTISQKRVDLLSFGFLAMIIFATNGVNAILKSFAKQNSAFKVRSFVREWGVALMLTIMLSVLILISVLLIVFGGYLIDLLFQKFEFQSSITYYLLTGLKWLIIIFIYFFVISIIYYFAPALKSKWKFFSVGGTVATILSVLASSGFSYYVNNFGQYNKFYGSLGTFIVIMIWIYINSLVLLLGFEINNSMRLFELTQEGERFELDDETSLG